MQQERKPEEKKPVNYPARVARILLKVILFLFLFVVLVFLLILTPPVQRFLTSKAESFLQNKLKTEVEIGGISFGLSGNVHLSNIYLEDQKKDTLLSGGSIKANLDLAKLFAGEIEVSELELKNITARIKRVLPDTVFNFQFIADAFTTAPNPADTAAAAPMKLAISDLLLDNVDVLFNDVITGSDMQVTIGRLNADIDSINLETSRYIVPLIFVNNVRGHLRQNKPLVEPEPVSADLAEAAAPIPLDLDFGKIDVGNVSFAYDNSASALFSSFQIGRLIVNGDDLDMKRQAIHLKDLKLVKSNTVIRMGRSEAAKVVEQEVEKEIAVQKTEPWSFRIDNIDLDGNRIQFDNDNSPKTGYGMDFAHLLADSLTLHIDNFVMNGDSIGGSITRGHFREQSGFRLDALEGDLLYAHNQSYLKNLYIKTPGTEIRRDLVLEYASYDALMNRFEQTVFEVAITDSRVQVKDILAFAPQLRGQPAFARPNEVWHLDIRGSGSLDRMHFENIHFDGLGQTELDAEGTLAGLTNPNQAGGTFTIRRFHTTQSDLALFTGQRLSTAEVALPESFTVKGTLSGNSAALNTDLDISTSAGFIALDGRFTNLTAPASATYNANIRTNGLQLGSILRTVPGLGSVSANFTASGTGFTPETMRAAIDGAIHSIGYNGYTYRNINLDGTFRPTAFDVDLVVRDPNVRLNLDASGALSGTPSFRVAGFVDSINTGPLNLTPQPLIFRGRIDADIPAIGPDQLTADVRITEGLLVSGVNRLPLDSFRFVSDADGENKFIRLTSPVVSAEMTGRYRFSDLGAIFQNNIQPYFSVNPTRPPQVAPYDIRFSADMHYHPILASFVPGLTAADTLHADGTLATGQGLQATVRSSFIQLQGNEIRNLNAQVSTSDSGLRLVARVDRLRSGNSFDLYGTEINATALNNQIRFNLGIEDKGGADRYRLAGLLTQPAPGAMTFSLNPDSLLLNYQRWTITPGNSISMRDNQILANDFNLQQNGQVLSLQSGTGTNPPLNVTFTAFRLGTITGFIKSDTLLVDGVMNGSVSLRNLMQQPVFTSNLTISDLSFRQDTVGNINLQVASSGERYVTDASITGKGNDIRVTGSFAPQGSALGLDLDLNVNRLELNTLEGMLSGFLKQASGAITGSVAINGTSTDPDLQGRLNFDSASFTTTLLGGPLTINDESIFVSSEGLQFNDFTIRDSANNTMAINGNVSTPNFINYSFGLDVRSRNFRALNADRKDNGIYFGSLVIDTDLHIGGTEQAPIIEGNLATKEGTDFSIIIPQAAPGVAQREGVVEFVNFNNPAADTLFLAAYDSLNNSGLKGFDLSVNIDLRKEASFNVIVDVANGDFLSLNGAGQLSAGIDPSGKVSLTGAYEIEDGAYQFSFNFLRRRFEIQKGSKITWLGEPTNAQVDVTAVYIANTAPLDLVESQIDEGQRNYYLQRLPFRVLLQLDGELMKPTLTFDIQLPPDGNYNVNGDVLTNVNTRLTQLRNEQSELNKQVFAILLLNRFVGENPFQSSGGGGGFNAGAFARQSVSKLMTEQLNELAAGLIDGVDLNFDVSSSDDFTTGQRRNRTDLNVGLSKRLLNDRLTVSVGSDFQLEGPQQSNQSSNNIAGNVAVNYQLSRDGRYALRFYRRNEYEGQVYGYVVETGLTFAITVDYNRFRQILQGRRQARERRAAQENAAKQESTEVKQNDNQNQQNNQPNKEQ
ncbi:MAG TPA: translocation/assembly module TamB domain-containing protein [Chitinophagaceae bacterium]|nr:translocation/assembly module TamB domain-containing protein [Chitinophagaceae bacterium]